MICVASGKGGVGKSTMTANLAAALTAEGHPAGALDCDVYGYSIPRMLGVNRKPEVNAERKILPLDAAGGVKVMSIGFFVEENAAVVWRGPMLHKAIQQFLEDVAWGELEYLLLDLPPGTGDVSMTLAQLLPQAKFVARDDSSAGGAVRGQARRRHGGKFDLELLGVIENMSGFTTPDGERFTIFGEGGGQLLADELDVPLLGKVPLSEACASTPTPAPRWSPRTPTRRPRRRSARPPAASSPRRRRSCRSCRPPRPRPSAPGQRHAAADGPIATHVAASFAAASQPRSELRHPRCRPAVRRRASSGSGRRGRRSQPRHRPRRRPRLPGEAARRVGRPWVP